MSKRVYDRCLIGIGLCIVVFILGYIILNYISTMENPPLGNTIYILIGSAFTFLSILGFILILKFMYDTKRKEERKERKRRKHKLFYLKDSQRKRKSKDTEL
jgi:cbb3-type cytochrome oxidase subunit 3